jgi:preprotein translocase subunit SecA
VLTTENTRKLVHDIIGEIIPAGVHRHLAECDPHDPDYSELLDWIRSTLPISIGPDEMKDRNAESISTLLADIGRDAYEARVAGMPAETLEQEERRMVLVAIDRHWQEHLADMDELREGVYLRAQGQKDPLVEYKNEGYELFVTLMDAIKQDALQNLFRSAAGLKAFLAQLHSGTATEGTLKLNLPERKPAGTPGRNDACTCDSGKKFKQCCGRFA